LYARRRPLHTLPGTQLRQQRNRFIPGALAMTNTSSYVAPAADAPAFNCPADTCGAYASQSWSPLVADHTPLADWLIGRCARCGHPSIWRAKIMVYPLTTTAPAPNMDTPSDVRGDYEEARAILSRSPRGAAALLRLAVQKLCKALGETGDNLNNDIAALVENGLLPSVKHALDAVRVIGNNAVHPGQFDLQDNPEVAEILFRLVNMIVAQMITAPNEAKSIYDSLPQSSLNAIAKRDGKMP